MGKIRNKKGDSGRKERCTVQRLSSHVGLSAEDLTVSACLQVLLHLNALLLLILLFKHFAFEATQTLALRQLWRMKEGTERKTGQELIKY